jgi:hypothetical protein
LIGSDVADARRIAVLATAKLLWSISNVIVQAALLAVSLTALALGKNVMPRR